MLSHPPSADADHEHSRAADTESLPDPPCAGSELVPLTVTLQRVTVDGEVTVFVEDPQLARLSRADVERMAEVRPRNGARIVLTRTSGVDSSASVLKNPATSGLSIDTYPHTSARSVAQAFRPARGAHGARPKGLRYTAAQLSSRL
jgi:hypothetical protein